MQFSLIFRGSAAALDSFSWPSKVTQANSAALLGGSRHFPSSDRIYNPSSGFWGFLLPAGCGWNSSWKHPGRRPGHLFISSFQRERAAALLLAFYGFQSSFRLWRKLTLLPFIHDLIVSVSTSSFCCVHLLGLQLSDVDLTEEELG